MPQWKKLLAKIFGGLRNAAWMVSLYEWIREKKWWIEGTAMMGGGIGGAAIFEAYWPLFLFAAGGLLCIVMGFRDEQGRRKIGAGEKNCDRTRQWRELTARARVLQGRLAEEMESGEPWSDDLSFAWQDFMERLRPFNIPSPNFSSLDPHCILYLRAYLTSLLVALEAEDFELARTAIERSSLPLHMQPDPRWKD